VRSWPALVCSGPALLWSGRLDAESGPADEGGAGDLVQAALSDYDIVALDEPSPDSLRAYFHDSTERDTALAALRRAFPLLHVAPVDVPDEDWAARSQASLTSIQVGHLIVSPPWDVDNSRRTPSAERPALNNDPVITQVVIQPSMGFGTGHHATTRLCLEALQRAHVTGRAVIDVGTGSGVLAIAASLLGSSPVIAVDDDPDAIQSATENLELNPGARVDLRTGDLRSATLGIADIVVANLTGTLLIQAAPQLSALVAPRGRLIVSGLLVDEEPDVVNAFPELAVLDRTQEDEWVCLVLASHGLLE